MHFRKTHALAVVCVFSTVALYWISRGLPGQKTVFSISRDAPSVSNTGPFTDNALRETEERNRRLTENNDQGKATLDRTVEKMDKEMEPVDKETGNVDTETGNVYKETGNMDKETGNVYKETGNMDKETGNVDEETGIVDKETQGERELDELVHILQSRLDNYNGSVLPWTKRVCSANTRCARVCFDASCPRQFSPSVRERLKQVLSLRSSLPEKYMPAVRSAARSVTSHKYIFVTGASSNHYGELQYLLHTMFEIFLPRFEGEDYALVVINLGLTTEERILTERNCRCTVLDFPLSVLPKEFTFLKCFVWRTLIVAALLEKAEYVMWADTSIRFRKSDPFPEAFHRARDHGMQSRKNWGSIACRTRPSTAQFYGDELCQYSAFGEMEGNILIVHNNRFTWEAIMKPWLSCAVTPGCQCIRRYSYRYLSCRGTKNGKKNATRTYGGCHRTQSAFGMILSKLYLEKRPMLYINGISIKRASKMDWFKFQ